ncbi:uncharacterized protein TNCV_1534071 [Trichonephila clavipes]|nr:uncharacterized protein TNCV_1534071 [Trichonephila clavipes]
MDETKVGAIVEMKPPRNSKEMSKFLGCPSDSRNLLKIMLIFFAYAIRTAVNKTTGKTPAEIFLGRKLVTPFQKLVMVSDGTEFAVGDIEKARRNTKAKHEKWEKYYNRRKRAVQV